jgi:hypothetical protein
MNAVPEEAHKHRSTDGVTLIKILLGSVSGLIMLFMGLITYIYTTNSSAVTGGMASIVSDVRQIREQGIITAAYVQNLSARSQKNEVSIEKLHAEARAYWRTP